MSSSCLRKCTGNVQERALWARASNRVTLDKPDETDKGQILDAGAQELGEWTLFQGQWEADGRFSATDLQNLTCILKRSLCPPCGNGS